VASNFAFYPQSTTTAFTVTPSTTTFQMTLQLAGGTSTVTLAAGAYLPQGCRVANTGTVNVHVMFTATGPNSPTLDGTNGFPILGGTVETFRVQGLPVAKMLTLAGTSTLWITAGEGL